MARIAQWEALEAALGYRFTNRRVLQLALTHRSCGYQGEYASNQRLEFLGDAVLQLAVADMLYELFPAEAEGDLSKRLVALVNGEQLARIARSLDLGAYLEMSEGEMEQGGKENASNLEDACEALLGAIYRDGGFSAARAVIERWWKDVALAYEAPPKDPKTALQEWAQGRGLPLPEYMLIQAQGPSHAPCFVVEVRVMGLPSVQAQAGTKKHAERLAAQAMLAAL